MPDQTETERPQIVKGARVGVDDPKYPGAWIVERVNPKTISLKPENGGRGLRCPVWMIIAAPEPAAPGQIGQPFVPIVRSESLRVGALVRLSLPLRVRGGSVLAPGEHLFVVIADKFDTVNVSLLGGLGEGTYWPKIPAGRVEVIDPASVVRSPASWRVIK